MCCYFLGSRRDRYVVRVGVHKADRAATKSSGARQRAASAATRGRKPQFKQPASTLGRRNLKETTQMARIIIIIKNSLRPSQVTDFVYDYGSSV